MTAIVSVLKKKILTILHKNNFMNEIRSSMNELIFNEQ
jgi:hypothetical protein